MRGKATEEAIKCDFALKPSINNLAPPGAPNPRAPVSALASCPPGQEQGRARVREDFSIHLDN